MSRRGADRARSRWQMLAWPLLLAPLSLGSLGACNVEPPPAEPPPPVEPEVPFYIETKPTELEDPCDGYDNNGDGYVDEACYCEANSSQICYPGPEGTENVGACRAGVQRCTDISNDFQLGSWGECQGAVVPADEEICGNGIDDDCDNQIDELCHEDVGCTPGTQTECYNGPPGTVGMGLCSYGLRTCDDDGAWGPCVGEVVPVEDICGNDVDEDCNGRDEECIGTVCTPGNEQTCYDGPVNTLNVGQCSAGVQTCTNEGKWTACEGQVMPSDEICDNNVDENCDGTYDACE